MGMSFDLTFYIKTKISKDMASRVIYVLLHEGAFFLSPEEKSDSKRKENCVFSAYDQMSDNFIDIPSTDSFLDMKNIKYPKISECIELISKYANGSLQIWYKDINFTLHFHGIDTKLAGYTTISLYTHAPSQFAVYDEKGEQNFRDFIFLADAVWNAIKPFFGECGLGLHNDKPFDIKKIEVGDLKDLEGELFYFSKELVEKIGKGTILSRADTKIPGSVKEFSDGSIRVIVHDYGNTAEAK